jgi:hypothetical protein
MTLQHFRMKKWVSQSQPYEISLNDEEEDMLKEAWEMKKREFFA